MGKSGSSKCDLDPGLLVKGDLVQLLEGLERQREDLGPIADELIDLLRDEPAKPQKPTDYSA